ncbi:transcription factor LBX2 [Vanacampus margaritifer]
MTSTKDMKAGSVLPSAGEGRRRAPLDRLPPPANSNKPLTPFSIEDILSKPSVKKSACSSVATGACPGRPRVLEKVAAAAAAAAAARNGINTPSSPLCALEELASKTFKGLEVNVIQAAEGREHLNAFGQRQASKKRRKSRTAFTNHQIYELEKRFLYQKYLSPADRDQIAGQLGLSNAQVITWFQNRRAKLKRDLEEMKADVESLKKITPHTLHKLVAMDGNGDEAAGEGRGGAGAGGGDGGGDAGEGSSPGGSPLCRGAPSSHRIFPQSPSSSRGQTTDEFSEDDEEIEVDD